MIYKIKASAFYAVTHFDQTNFGNITIPCIQYCVLVCCVHEFLLRNLISAVNKMVIFISVPLSGIIKVT